MSELPKGWLEVELSEVAEVIRGVTYKKEQAIDAPKEGFLPVLRATNITGAALTFEGLVYVPLESVSETQLLKTGDVVIASSSGSKEIVGKAGSFTGNSFVGSFGAFCSGLRPSEHLSAGYFGFFFQTPSYRKSVSGLSSGSNINNLKTSDLASQRFSLPPRAEQTRIVAKLEELLSDLDAGVAELKAAQKKLGQYRQSLLKAAVEGALTAEWRMKNTPAETGAQLLQRILSERRARWEAKQRAKFAEQGKAPPKDWQKKYPEPVQPDTSDLPALPEGWVWASVDQVGEVFLGKMLDKTKHVTGNKLPYLRNINVRWGIIDFSDLLEMFFENDELDRYGLVSGDVLVCEGGEPGRSAVYRGEFAQMKYQKALHRVRFWGLYEPQLLVMFLEYSAKSGKLEKSFTGSTIKHFTKESFLQLAVPLPSQEEQDEIVRVISQSFEAIFEQELAINLSLKQSAAQRQNILRAAFAGQLVPQDQNDEPASVLLERIRAERAAQASVKKPRGRQTPIQE